MLPDILADTDVNRLPYCVTTARTGQRQNVYFAPLLAEDEAQLRGPDWSQAVFRDVWPAYAGDPQTFKLLCDAELSVQILGLVQVGQLNLREGYLWKSILETAPSHQAGIQTQSYKGIGRVLVARLVAESYRRGVEGRLIVEARPRAAKFYARLGFQKAKKDNWLLTAESAASLLASALR